MSALVVFPLTNGLPLMKNTFNERGAVILTCVCRNEKYISDRNTVAALLGEFIDRYSCFIYTASHCTELVQLEPCRSRQHSKKVAL